MGQADASKQGRQPPSDVAHEAELVQLAAQCKKHREPDKGDQGASLQVDIVEREDICCQEHTQTGEGHRSEAQVQCRPPSPILSP